MYVQCTNRYKVYFFILYNLTERSKKHDNEYTKTYPMIHQAILSNRNAHY